MADFTQIFATIVASVAALFNFNVFPAHAAPEVRSSHVSILFGGDMMLDRSIRSIAKEKGGDFIFSCIDPLLEDENLVVANLEGPMTDHASVSIGTVSGSIENMTFTFPTSTADLLYAHNIRLVNLGNNHIENFGQSGVSSTTAALEDARVGYFGDPLDFTVAAEEVGGVFLSFINYNEFGGNATTTVRQIIEVRGKGRLPIVYTHWGVEYSSTTPEYIRALAHRFVDAGAEIIIGSHPHVVGEREFYKEKYIYYSLGNLIFDQYWDDAVSHGLTVRVALDSSGVMYVEEIPVELKRDGRTCPLNKV